jgi:glycosyltransferase involved in cell wall biosynthesis
MHDFHPLVSIVIPVYNGSNYMRCAIDSALGQDYDNIEVIVVNDGSVDDTDSIARSYGDKIRYFSKENGGVSRALNLAIQNAKGEYISWLSHDDYYLSNKISRQIEELGRIEERDKLIACCGYKVLNVIDKNEKVDIILNNTRVITKLDFLRYLYDSHLHGCSFLIPIASFKKIGFFNEKLLTTQDTDLWIRLINADYLLCYVAELLLITRQHKEQTSIMAARICHHERIELWNFANKIFYNDIRNSSKLDKVIFRKRSSLNENINYIKKILYIRIPFLKMFYDKIRHGLINCITI